MTILITGISGMIGSYLADYLSHAHRVIGISRDTGGDDVIKADLLQLTSKQISKILFDYDIDIIVHCAANKKPKTIDDLYLNSFILNNFLSSDLGKKKRYLVIGSAAEYGLENCIGNVLHENSSTEPDSLYGRSKLLQTALAGYYRSFFNCDITVLRLFNIIAPDSSHTSFIGGLLASIINKRQITVSNLQKQRDFIDIRDFVEIINLIVEKAPKSFIYNIASGSNVTYAEVINKFTNLLVAYDLKKPVVKDMKEKEAFQPACDIGKIRAEYGWQPKYNLEDSLKWCLEQKGIIKK